MGSVINVTQTGYSEYESAENWAAVYAKRVVDEHKTSPVLDHPDGSVTEDKLSGDVKEKLAGAVLTAQTASETASTAKAVADDAVSCAERALNTSNETEGVAYEAIGNANLANETANAANETANAAEQRAISAETKADAAVASASGAVQKAEGVQADLEEHRSDTDIHTTAAEKEEINERIIAHSENIYVLGEMALNNLQYWQPDTYYNEGQVIYKTGSENCVDEMYRCVKAHTSGENFIIESNGTVFWEKLADVKAVYADESNVAHYASYAEYDMEGDEIITTYAKKAELETKADKATTLEGYGIADAYTKTEIDIQIGDIETALDSILAIQNTLLGGDAE